ncbi:MAG TPA: zinc ribbon domain-containing protein [Gemmatimonadales bacterium]|nr:zinc ribbon domain-containing protein [Gemmatimonadales bacterium]
MTCPSCGRPSSGKFCSECGASLAGATCASCGAPLSPGARFCHLCGAPAGRAARVPAADRNLVPWLVAVAAVAVVVVVWVGRTTSQPPAVATGAPTPPGATGGAATTDLSTMTPRQQADRLFDRVMRASSRGDTNEITFFAPMAIQAYGMLGSLDVDARYHVALLEAETGNLAGMLAQADSIERESAAHLFVTLLRAEAAKRSGDTAQLARLYRRFLDTYQQEQASGKQEYRDHQPALDIFRDAAQAATSAR